MIIIVVTENVKGEKVKVVIQFNHIYWRCNELSCYSNDGHYILNSKHTILFKKPLPKQVSDNITVSKLSNFKLSVKYYNTF